MWRIWIWYHRSQFESRSYIHQEFLKYELTTFHWADSEFVDSVHVSFVFLNEHLLLQGPSFPFNCIIQQNEINKICLKKVCLNVTLDSKCTSDFFWLLLLCFQLGHILHSILCFELLEDSKMPNLLPITKSQSSRELKTKCIERFQYKWNKFWTNRKGENWFRIGPFCWKRVHQEIVHSCQEHPLQSQYHVDEVYPNCKIVKNEQNRERDWLFEWNVCMFMKWLFSMRCCYGS